VPRPEPDAVGAIHLTLVNDRPQVADARRERPSPRDRRVAMRSAPHHLVVNLVNSGKCRSCGMTDTVNLYDAKTNLSKLVDRAAAGEEIIIAKAGKPKAKLVPYQPPRKKRRFGQNLLGITYVAEDFDAPLPPELQKYFE
jgi:prevent-host-death family protein